MFTFLAGNRKKRYLQKLSTIYNEHGLWQVIKRGSKKGVSFIFETNSAIWHVKALSDRAIEIEPAIQLSLEFTDFNETLEWIKRQNVQWMINEKETLYAVNEGHYWPSIRHQEKIIGYLKVGFGKVYIRDYEASFEFPRNTAYIYDTFVSSRFRKKGVATYFISETCNFLKEEGFEKVVCHIPAWNTASLKAYSHAGFRRIKTIRWIKILGLKVLTSNPVKL